MHLICSVRSTRISYPLIVIPNKYSVALYHTSTRLRMVSPQTWEYYKGQPKANYINYLQQQTRLRSETMKHANQPIIQVVPDFDAIEKYANELAKKFPGWIEELQKVPNQPQINYSNLKQIMSSNLYSLETAFRLKHTEYLISFGADIATREVKVDDTMKGRYKTNDEIGVGLKLALDVRNLLFPKPDESLGEFTCPYYVDYEAVLASSFTTPDHRNLFWKYLWLEAQTNAKGYIFLVSNAWLESPNCYLEYTMLKSKKDAIFLFFEDTDLKNSRTEFRTWIDGNGKEYIRKIDCNAYEPDAPRLIKIGILDWQNKKKIG